MTSIFTGFAQRGQGLPALCSQSVKPPGIDLHHTIVEGAVAVPVNRLRIEIALLAGDGLDQLRRNPIGLAGAFKAE